MIFVPNVQWRVLPVACVAAAVVSMGVGTNAQVELQPGRSATASEVPSTTAVRGAYLAGGQRLVSVSIPDALLKELLANPEGRGREWEREGSVSVYDGERLLFETKVGVRLHGSSGREAGREAFRLVFRKSYGLPRLPDGVLAIGTRSTDRVVVRRSQGLEHTQPIAFEIAQRLGAIAPAAVSVRFVMNGAFRPRGYELTEHVSREGWADTYFGHSDYLFYQFRGTQLPEDEAGYRDLREWLDAAPRPLLMAQAAERVDLENLIRHALAIAYCGTTDWAQGAAVLDGRSPRSRWFWVHWDMDQSFWSSGSEPWTRPSLRLLMAPGRGNERADVRARLLQRLLREDPAFVRHFLAVVSSTMNHALSPEYLRSLVERYRTMAVGRTPFRGFNLQGYFDRRADVVIDSVAQELGLAKPSEVRVEVPAGARLDIDGQRHTSGFVGRYFQGQIVTVRALGPDGRALGTWSMDGRQIQAPTAGEPIAVTVTGNTLLRIAD